MLNVAHPFWETAIAIARSATPLDIHRMKHLGLNRAFRRKLQSLARRGHLTASDLPVWLVASIIIQEGPPAHG